MTHDIGGPLAALFWAFVGVAAHKRWWWVEWRARSLREWCYNHFGPQCRRCLARPSRPDHYNARRKICCICEMWEISLPIIERQRKLRG